MDRASILSPDPAERLARARGDLRAGLPVALTGGGAVWLAIAAEVARPDRAAAMAARGDAVLALTERRARTLKIAAYDGDLVRLRVAPGADAAWLGALADPSRDLAAPLKGPFATLRGGDAAPARAALSLAKAARLLPACLMIPVPAPPEGITLIDRDEAAPAPPRLARIVSARLPIAVAADARLHLFRPEGGEDEHYAVEIGRPDRAAPVLARLHSACFTGDVLGSLKCDCGPQLQTALGRIAAEGAGILLYLNQEGRGIGLTNKLRAYALQDQGFDTVEANHRLGFEDDERDFGIGAAILSALGVDRVRLMTNNPAKVAMLEANGIAVAEREPLWVGRTPQNAGYLSVKALKSGHLE